MELPFAVESPDSVRADIRAKSNNSLQHSESSSLVTASSQESFINPTNHNLDISDHCDSFIPNIHRYLPPRHNSQSQQQTRQQQGQLVVIPALEVQTVGIKNGGYVDPENDFTYVNVTEIDTDEESPLSEVQNLKNSQDQMKGNILSVLIGEMQHGESRSILVSAGKKATHDFVC